jgi:hypothetical protein
METKKVIDGTVREQLRAPFPTEAYSPHPTKTFLTTLKAMYVTERLNDVFGVGRWYIEPEVIERTADYVLMKGTFISLDFDIVPITQYGGHSTSGKNTEIADGYKSALTDCQSKIAYEALPWINEAFIKNMIATVPKDRQKVIDSLVNYRWSKVNKEKIIAVLDAPKAN